MLQRLSIRFKNSIFWQEMKIFKMITLGIEKDLDKSVKTQARIQGVDQGDWSSPLKFNI